jgi:hypothetical protein
MENHNIRANNNIHLEVNAPCPKCEEGNLLPFLKPIYERGALYGAERNPKFSHYDIFYRCSKYNYMVEADSYF